MFGIGPMELMVVLVVAVLVIGPDKLPAYLQKFGKLFVQVRRQANEVKSSFNEVIHEAERELELKNLRQLQEKLQNTTPTQLLEASLSENQPEEAPAPFGPGLDADGHPLPGFDDHGFPLSEDIPEQSVARGMAPHYEARELSQKVPAQSDGLLAWDPGMTELHHPDTEDLAAAEIKEEHAQQSSDSLAPSPDNQATTASKKD